MNAQNCTESVFSEHLAEILMRTAKSIWKYQWQFVLITCRFMQTFMQRQLETGMSSKTLRNE